MKTNIRLLAVTLTLLCASLAGCIGDDDSDSEEYSGPIDLIVYYESTSGMVETSENNGQAGPTTGVELSFDFADTTSSGGSIAKIMLDPDDGSDPVEGDPADNAVISYTWLTHGVFTVTLTAEDSEGDSHSIMVKVKIDMHIDWSESSGPDASMTFDVTSDCSDGLPLADRITLSSTATNQGGFILGGGNSEVTWSLIDPFDEEISSHSGTIAADGEETWDYTTRDMIEGLWKLDVEVTNDEDVSVDNDVTIAYAEGAEDAINPRPE